MTTGTTFTTAGIPASGSRLLWNCSGYSYLYSAFNQNRIGQVGRQNSIFGANGGLRPVPAGEYQLKKDERTAGDLG